MFDRLMSYNTVIIYTIKMDQYLHDRLIFQGVFKIVTSHTYICHSVSGSCGPLIRLEEGLTGRRLKYMACNQISCSSQSAFS